MAARWTPDQDALLKALYHQCAHVREIARAVGRVFRAKPHGRQRFAELPADFTGRASMNTCDASSRTANRAAQRTAATRLRKIRLAAGAVTHTP